MKVITLIKEAETILQFTRSEKQGRYLIVRYEDIYTNTKDEMTRMLYFLGMDIERYDFQHERFNWLAGKYLENCKFSFRNLAKRLRVFFYSLPDKFTRRSSDNALVKTRNVN